MSIYDNSVFDRPMTAQEFVDEFQHTWPRHEGYASRAADVFDLSREALARRLYRYKRQGLDVQFIDDTKALRS